ncbi:MAG: c-type cytochrome domain-containing protein [Verrucomicrobiales bacterium]
MLIISARNFFMSCIGLMILGSTGFGQDVDYKKQIAPILSSKCNSCHTAKKKESDKKPKAGLALDTPIGMRSGGVLEPGDALSSELYIRVSLPKNAEDLMPPPDDGSPLSTKEIALIKKWIDDGAKFSSGSGGALEKIPTDLDARKVKSMPVREPNADAIAHLEGLGATVDPVSVTLPEYLSIEWISTYHKITDKEIEQILHLAANVVEADLSRTKVTNEGLKHVGKLGRLTHLNLNRTEIDDKGIAALADLQSLEWLNLYGTKVTDASMPIIAKYRDLKAVYLWNTAVTSNGVSTLRKALPEAKIVRDTDDRAGRFDNLEDPGKFDF